MSLSVIVAEDDTGLRHIYQRILTALGCTTFLACDGQEALYLLDLHAPDLLVLDMRLPQIGGVQIIDYILTDTRFAHMHTIMTSADPTYEQQAKRLPSAQFHLKPLLASDLRNMLQDYIERTNLRA
jgi:two-component system response regulator (stage 0 sporulation protein F)